MDELHIAPDVAQENSPHEDPPDVNISSTVVDSEVEPSGNNSSEQLPNNNQDSSSDQTPTEETFTMDRNQHPPFPLVQPSGRLKRGSYLVFYCRDSHAWETARLISAENPRYPRYYNIEYLQRNRQKGGVELIIGQDWGILKINQLDIDFNRVAPELPPPHSPIAPHLRPENPPDPQVTKSPDNSPFTEFSRERLHGTSSSKQLSDLAPRTPISPANTIEDIVETIDQHSHSNILDLPEDDETVVDVRQPIVLRPQTADETPLNSVVNLSDVLPLADQGESSVNILPLPPRRCTRFK